jgi:hypothetical protein
VKAYVKNKQEQKRAVAVAVAYCLANARPWVQIVIQKKKNNSNNAISTWNIYSIIFSRELVCIHVVVYINVYGYWFHVK